MPPGCNVTAGRDSAVSATALPDRWWTLVSCRLRRVVGDGDLARSAASWSLLRFVKTELRTD